MKEPQHYSQRIYLLFKKKNLFLNLALIAIIYVWITPISCCDRLYVLRCDRDRNFNRDIAYYVTFLFPPCPSFFGVLLRRRKRLGVCTPEKNQKLSPSYSLFRLFYIFLTEYLSPTYSREAHPVSWNRTDNSYVVRPLGFVRKSGNGCIISLPSRWRLPFKSLNDPQCLFCSGPGRKRLHQY